MPDTKIRTLQETETVLTKCPVFVQSDNQIGYERCDAPLEVVCNENIVGDDYGSWPVYSIQFRCGHDFRSMTEAIYMSDHY